MHLPISINYGKNSYAPFKKMNSWLEEKDAKQFPLWESLQLEFKTKIRHQIISNGRESCW